MRIRFQNSGEMGSTETTQPPVSQPGRNAADTQAKSTQKRPASSPAKPKQPAKKPFTQKSTNAKDEWIPDSVFMTAYLDEPRVGLLVTMEFNLKTGKIDYNLVDTGGLPPWAPFSTHDIEIPAEKCEF